jgi:DNA-binding CsgD family transcriptional regulator
MAGPDGRVSETEVVLRTTLSAAAVRATAGRLYSAGLVAEVPSADGARVYRVLGLPSAMTAAAPEAATSPRPSPPAAPLSGPAAGIDVLVTRHGLTPAEANVLALLSNGLTNEQIAGKLFVAPATVRTHVYNLFRKLGVRSRVQAARLVLGAPAEPPPAGGQ